MRGVILTVPTTISFGLLFLGLSKSARDAADAAIIIPAALGVDYLFPVCFAYMLRWGVWRALLGAYLTWFIGAFVLLYMPPADIAHATVFYFIPLVLFGYWLIRRLKVQEELVPVSFSLKHLLVRSFFGGMVVASIVMLAHIFNNAWGGLFTTFPTAFSATLLIYYYVHGERIIASVARSLFFPGAIGFSLYAIVIHLAASYIGMWWGTALAYIVVVLFYWLYVMIFHGKK